ncbi:ankyrin repeat domain-containing protein 45 [Bufo gargarizans]|uniref:ankyrin repeat domain-containing protein 45 n=1 Tax=Bufo gargarizans TaxID=30331 RepID=UPI001CF4DFB1|nr:ankyrin repeat domain-containing protein 45 [Bufo gargarizans]XP_044156644.1 ankyrin repeat domain-containing protein 45 [Bufo gargarizans]XP_044156645.1 ankyrin repeat domain-containing protein 45 [Bufo gargarizans]
MDILNPLPRDNPVLQCVLEGNLQGLQSIFEDPADDHHEQCNKLLVEEDLLGRNPLFVASILGRTEVVKGLAKYGANINQQTARGYSPLHCAAAWGQVEVLKALVDLGGDILLLNFRGEKACEIATRYNKTECADFLKWAEARLALKSYISFIQQTISDPEKVHGKLHKEDKNQAVSACKSKNEWLQNAKDPTTQDFVDQKQQLENAVQHIFTKLSTPRVETGKSKQ